MVTSCGILTLEWLRRRTPTAIVSDWPVLSSEMRPTSANLNCLDSYKTQVVCPRWCLTPRRIGRLTAGRNITVTLTVWLALLGDDTCICATDGKEGYVSRKLQRGLSTGTLKSMKTGLGPSASHIDLTTWDSTNVKGVTFDKRITGDYM
jgi:hypothetical protein